MHNLTLSLVKYQKLEGQTLNFEGIMVNSFLIITFIFLLSLALGYMKYGSLADQYKGKAWQLKFIEFWNDSLNFLITGLVGWYFVAVRLPLLVNGNDLNVGDFFLFLVFMLGVFGHLCVMSKNISEGIEAILKRVLDRG